MQAGLSLSGSAGVPLHETLTLPSHSLAAIAVAPAPFAPPATMMRLVWQCFEPYRSLFTFVYVWLYVPFY